MTAAIILILLCLAAASVILRVILFFTGRNDQGYLAKIASIGGTIGFSPLVAFEWAMNFAMACLLIFLLAYWIVPHHVADFIAGVTNTLK
jgi:hypothetical protein